MWGAGGASRQLPADHESRAHQSYQLPRNPGDATAARKRAPLDTSMCLAPVADLELSRIHTLRAHGQSRVCVLSQNELAVCSVVAPNFTIGGSSSSSSTSWRSTEAMLKSNPSRASIIEASGLGGGSGGRSANNQLPAAQVDFVLREFAADTVCWDPDGKFLFCGDSQGRIHCVHVPSKAVIWQQPLAETGFLGIQCHANFCNGDHEGDHQGTAETTEHTPPQIAPSSSSSAGQHVQEAAPQRHQKCTKFSLSFLLRNNVVCCFEGLDFGELDSALEHGQPELVQAAVSKVQALLRKSQVRIPNARQFAMSGCGAGDDESFLFALSDSALLAYTYSAVGFQFRDSIPMRSDPVLVEIATSGSMPDILATVLIVVYEKHVEVYDAKAMLLLSKWSTPERIRAASVVHEKRALCILTDRTELRRVTNGEVLFVETSSASATTSQLAQARPPGVATRLVCSGLFVASDSEVCVVAEQASTAAHAETDAQLQQEHQDLATLLDDRTATVSQLRRQMEIAVERSIQGELKLQPRLIVGLARKLANQVPGFVAQNALRCAMGSCEETRALLLDIAEILQTASAPKAYDLKRGLLTITEALARLATFEQLSELRRVLNGLSVGKTMLRASLSGRGKQGGLAVGAARIKELAMIAAKNSCTGVSGAERSRASLRNNNRESAAAAASSRSAGGGQHLEASQQEWNAAIWQQFRLTSLPQLCKDLAEAERISDMLCIFARHGTKFSQQEIMTLLEAIPFCSLAEDEAKLPDWVGSEVLPLLSHATERHDARRRLVNWLTDRALDLEQAKGCDRALALLRAVLAPPKRMLFPEAFVSRANLWAGVALHHKQQVRSCNKNENKLRVLFLELAEMVCLRDVHAFPVRLRDLKQLSHADIISKFLQRVGAAGLLKDEIAHHVGVYCARHELDLDSVLSEYIRANLAANDSGGLFPGGDRTAMREQEGGAPQHHFRRLERCTEVLKCIRDAATKGKALLYVLQMSNQGLEDALASVVEDCKSSPDVPQDLKDEIDGQIRLLDAYDVLARHNLSQKVMINPVFAQRVALYLLSSLHVERTMDDALVLLRVFPGAILSPLDARILRATKIVSSVDHHAGSTSTSYEKQAADLRQVLSGAGEQCLEVCDGVVEFCCGYLKGVYEKERTEERVLAWLQRPREHPLSSEQVAAGGASAVGSSGGGGEGDTEDGEHRSPPENGPFCQVSSTTKRECQQHCDLAIVAIQHVFGMKNWHDVSFYHRRRRRSSDNRHSGGNLRRRSAELSAAWEGTVPGAGHAAGFGAGDYISMSATVSVDEEEEEAAYGSGWTTFNMLDALQRLQKLQKQFDLYAIDPLLLLGHRSAGAVLSALFERHAIGQVHVFLEAAEAATALGGGALGTPAGGSSSVVTTGAAQDGTTTSAVLQLQSKSKKPPGAGGTTSGLFTRLLHLADLFGLGRTYVWQLIVREASSKGQVASLRLTMDLVPKDHTLRETSGELLDLVRGVVSHFRTNFGRNQKNCAALIFHLAHLLDLLTYCLDWCGARPEQRSISSLDPADRSAPAAGGQGQLHSPGHLQQNVKIATTEQQNLLPLVTYAGDLHFAVNLLLNSDLLDTDAHVRETAPRTYLSVLHAHVIENLHQHDPYEALFTKEFKEVASLLPGRSSLRMVLDFLTEPQYLECPGYLDSCHQIVGESGAPGSTTASNGHQMHPPVRTAPYRLSNTPAQNRGRSHPYRRTSTGLQGKDPALARMNSMPARFNDNSNFFGSYNNASRMNVGANKSKLSLPLNSPTTTTTHTPAAKSAIREIYDLLRTARSLDAAKQVIARGLWAENAIDVSPRNNWSSNSHLYQELCQESALQVIFGTAGGAALDHLLFLGYMGCLSQDVCRDVYQQAVTQIEQEGALLKMQSLSTLGRVLGFLLRKDDLKLRMEKSETTWKWSSRLKGFDLPFDLSASDMSKDKRLTQDLLPQIVKKSDFSLPIVLEFACDFGLRKEEVLGLWVELMLRNPMAPAKNRCWTVQMSSEGQEVFKQVFDQSYQHKIPPQLLFLDDPRAVLETVLSAISPYDYERIRFVLRFLAEKKGGVEAGNKTSEAAEGGDQPMLVDAPAEGGARRHQTPGGNRTATTLRQGGADEGGLTGLLAQAQQSGGGQEVGQGLQSRMNPNTPAAAGVASSQALSARPSSPHPFPRRAGETRLSAAGGDAHAPGGLGHANAAGGSSGSRQQTATSREASAEERVLEVLHRYHRFAKPSDREKREISRWRKEHGLSPEVEQIVLQLAESRLPWHYLLQPETRWSFLRPELASSEDGVKRLLPVTGYLAGVSTDDVHLEYLKHLLTMNGGHSRKSKMTEHLRLIQDREKAERAAAEIQKQLKLSPELCEVAAFRAERASEAVLQQIEDLDKNPDRDPRRRVRLRQLQDEKGKLVKNSQMLRSRLDLRQWGWEAFENVLVRLGAVHFMTCIYYYLAPRTAKSLNEFHARVDAILRRHGFDPKKEKITLMRTWLTSAAWTPADLVKNDPAGQAEIAELEKTFKSESLPQLKVGEFQFGGSSSSSSSSAPSTSSALPFAALTELWCQSPGERQMVARIALVAAPGVSSKTSISSATPGTGGIIKLPASVAGGPVQIQSEDAGGVTTVNGSGHKRPRNCSPDRDNPLANAKTNASGGAVGGGGEQHNSSSSANESGPDARGGAAAATASGSLQLETGTSDADTDTASALRSVIRLCLHWLLRDSLTTNACCRCFCVLLQVATVSEILAVYHHPPEELWDYFRTFLYLNALEKLRVGHIDLATFRDTDKEGLARSYWRQQHKDPLLVAVITGLVLDFQVHDPRFLAQILHRLHQLQMWTFLKDALLHLHNSGFLLELCFDRELATAFQKVLLDHVVELLMSSNDRSNNSLEAAAEWADAVPGLLKRSPYLTHLKVLDTAKRILDLSLATNMGRQLLRELSGGSWASGSRGTTNTTTASSTMGSKCGESESLTAVVEAAFAGRDEAAAPRSALSGSAVVAQLVASALEIAYCSPDCGGFLEEYAVGKFPALLPLCLAGTPPAPLRPLLFRAVLDRNLVKEVRLCSGLHNDSQMFSELVIFAVKQSQIKDLLNAAIEQNLLEEAVNLVFLYAKHHGILHVWADDGGDEGRRRSSAGGNRVTHVTPRQYLKELLAGYENAADKARREFARLCRLKQ